MMATRGALSTNIRLHFDAKQHAASRVPRRAARSKLSVMAKATPQVNVATISTEMMPNERNEEPMWGPKAGKVMPNIQHNWILNNFQQWKR